ncbi:M23 family metallopeptidase [Coleofasciculus sp. FACHB-501]|nr:M23 family metallopeptidase [Coleofasciculus sp. FACHB-501]MBD1836669.1 M23 family metallopeptidase [Coleofasciculus sp. FACHB-501]
MNWHKAISISAVFIASFSSGKVIAEELDFQKSNSQISEYSPEILQSDHPITPMSGYIMPTKGTITSGYGKRWGKMHKGIDIAAPVGTPVVAAAPGVVVYARWNTGGYGNLVDIQHPDGSLTRYGHNSRLLVREGQQVSQGEAIALVGSTGRSTGPHCHFEIRTGEGIAVNPAPLMRNAIAFSPVLGNWESDR